MPKSPRMVSSKRWLGGKQADRLRRHKRGKRHHEEDPSKSERRSGEGRNMEAKIASILQSKRDLSLISDFTKFRPHSPADAAGYDFEIMMLEGRKIAFGVTISFSSYKRYHRIHPGQECLYIPSESSKDEIWTNIQMLLARS